MTNQKLDTSSWPPAADIAHRVDLGEFIKNIAKEMNVSRHQLTRYLAAYRTQSVEITRDVIVASDQAFIKRMIRNIKLGKETVVPGVITVECTSFSRVIRGDAIFSGCGSPAGMCSDSDGAGV